MLTERQEVLFAEMDKSLDQRAPLIHQLTILLQEMNSLLDQIEAITSQYKEH